MRKRTIIGTLVLIIYALIWTTTKQSFGADEVLSLEASSKSEVDVERFGPLWSSLYGQVVDYAPDGRRIAVGGQGTVFILDAESYQIEKQLFGHTGLIMAVRWSPDGKYLASGALVPDTAVRIWEVESGAVMRTFPGADVQSIAWSPDGSRLAFGAGPGGGHAIYDIETGRRLLEGITQGGDVVAWSPDGRYLAIGFSLLGSYGIRVYEAETGTAVREFRGHGIFLRAAAWSPDGRYLASGADLDLSVNIWEVATGGLVIRLQGGAVSIAWSPDGSYLVASGRIWETETWTLVRTLGPGTASVSWSPDGDYVASAGFGLVQVWDVEAGASIVSLRGHRNGVGDPTWSPDGRYIASAEGVFPFGEDNLSLKVWDVRTGSVVRTLCEGSILCPIGSLDWSPNGKYLASTSLDVVLWDTDTWREAKRIPGARGLVRWSPDGKYLASMYDRTINVWEAETGDWIAAIEVEREITPRVTSIAWSPDGNYLASSAHNPDSTVRIWEVGTWELVKTLPGLTDLGIRALTWSPDSQYVAGIEGSCCVSGEIRIWELETGNLIRTIGQGSGVVSLMWSPDGRYLASGGAYPGTTIKIWEAETGNLIRTLPGHTDLITSVRWSPDGRYLASGSVDRTVRVWGEVPDE